MRLISAALAFRFAAPRPRTAALMPRTAAVSFRTAALATLERSDRDASPRLSNRDPPRPPDKPTHRPTNPAPRSTTTFRGVSRLVSVLPRFAAELGFAFPHLTGLFTPVAAFCRDPRFRALHFMGVFTPVAAAPHPRFAWARTVYPRSHALLPEFETR